ncbi:MAG TPA: hypothetical protein VIG06_20025 [Kofleriaceae bacterium]
MKGSDRAGAPVRSLSALVFACSGLFACATEVPTSTQIDTGGDEVGSLVNEGLFGVSGNNGSVDVTLHPGPAAPVGSTTIVSFGVPFPRMALRDKDDLRAFDSDGDELPIHVRETLRWRVFPGANTRDSIRAAVVSIQIHFADRSPHPIQLVLGSHPGVTIGAPADPLQSWVAVTDGEYPSGTVREPRVYATFPSSWLSRCVLRSRTAQAGGNPAFGWLDDFMIGAAHTAVNDVPVQVTERVNYTTDYEPWLFDRTATLFGVFARTGDVEWLRHAHRSAQFYKAHVDADGFFDLKSDPDLKYSYGRSLVTDYLFTGDPELLDAVDRIAAAGRTWDPTYDMDTNFWTERHQTYALLAALAAWEVTGEARHSNRVTQIAQVSFALAADPVGSWPDNDCMLHGMTAHEGAGGDVPICSPWMSALFADAVFEYYIQSRDQDALDFLAGLGRYVRDHGLYAGGDGLDYTMPWYLSSTEMQFSDEGPWGDIEHTCDVGAMVARAAWADAQLGGAETASLRGVADDLLTGCQYNLDMWHRPAAPESSGQSEWRLSPGRKFNWWFGTTNDLTWLLAAESAGS